MRWFPKSAKSSEPSGANAKPAAAYNVAAVAGPPSPLKPISPVPATVVMIPSGLIFRIREFDPKYNAPSLATTASIRYRNEACVAGPPSPQGFVDGEHALPFPAKVVMIPSEPTWRIRLLYE